MPLPVDEFHQEGLKPDSHRPRRVLRSQCISAQLNRRSDGICYNKLLPSFQTYRSVHQLSHASGSAQFDIAFVRTSVICGRFFRPTTGVLNLCKTRISTVGFAGKTAFEPVAQIFWKSTHHLSSGVTSGVTDQTQVELVLEREREKERERERERES